MVSAKRSLPARALLLVAAVLVVAGFSCPRSGGEQAPEEPVTEKKPASPLIAADEFFGLNTKLGAPFVSERLREELTESAYPVQPSLQFVSEKYVSGTGGDGTVYFNIFPNPREPGFVGSLTIGSDLQTAFSEDQIAEDEYVQLAEKAKALAVEMEGDAQYITKYVAAEAILSARRNPDIATQAGIQVGSTREDILNAYGEPHEIVFEYGDTTLIYRGEEAALAFRTGADIVVMAIVFPAKYDYFEFRDATRAALESPEKQAED